MPFKSTEEEDKKEEKEPTANSHITKKFCFDASIATVLCGIVTLREEQRTALEASIGGKDDFVLLLTDHGESFVCVSVPRWSVMGL